MAIKAVFFDAAGTLFDAAKPIGETYASIARAYGKDVPAGAIQARFHACYGDAPPLAFPRETPAARLRDLEQGWWKSLVGKIFEPFGSFPRFDEYFSALFGHFARPDSWRLYPEAEAALSALKDRRLILAVITNFDSRVLGILEGLSIASLFDGIVISSRAGHAKPQPGIFHAALSLYSLRPEKALHVGDSLTNDVAGARRAGLTPVLIDRAGEARHDTTLCVRDLREVVALVDAAPFSSA